MNDSKCNDIITKFTLNHFIDQPRDYSSHISLSFTRNAPETIMYIQICRPTPWLNVHNNKRLRSQIELTCDCNARVRLALNIRLFCNLDQSDGGTTLAPMEHFAIT